MKPRIDEKGNLPLNIGDPKDNNHMIKVFTSSDESPRESELPQQPLQSLPTIVDAAQHNKSI